MQDSLNDGIELSKSDAEYKVMTNGAASALADGTVVVLTTSDNNGQTVALPAAEADSNVFGVVHHRLGKGNTYAVGEDMLICVDGVCKTKVNGTDNISAGSLLKVYDVNGIGYAAVAGVDSLSTIFGTALEAYTPDNSSGYINCYIRKR